MSAFQVVVTPNRLKNKKRQEAREPTDVVMAPFSAKAIVQFEGVPVTKTARRVLHVINMSEDSIQVFVTKSISPEHNVSLSWTECTVPGCGKVDMEMVWNPVLEVACLETLQLTDSRNFRKDVSVILKSKSNKPTKTVRKFPNVSSGLNAHVKTMRLKSPKGANKTGKSILLNQQRKRLPLKNDQPPPKQPHWNSSIAVTQKQSAAAAMPMRQKSPFAERNLYVNMCLGAGSSASIVVSPLSCGNERIQKENVSPSTPSNVLSLIDKMKFTPTTETISKAQPDLQDLASLPTPVSSVYMDMDALRKEIRPRRLSASEFSGIESNAYAMQLPDVRVELHNDTLGTSITVSNNKTFDIKRSETFNLSNMDSSLNASPVAPTTNVPTESLNRTTIITCTPYGRPLEMIREEDSFIVAGQQTLDKTYQRPCTCGAANNSPTIATTTTTDATDARTADQNLKRDINLVGTPLRKYSESMMELTIKSPSTSKIGIQGSMPNLNDLESIRSIEQNRYFYQSNSSVQNSSNISPQWQKQKSHMPKSNATSKLNISAEILSNSQTSLISHADSIFNQNEILAQSSRFNLNELTASSTRRNSPKKLWHHPSMFTDQTPCMSDKKLTKDKDLNVSGQKRKSFELSFSDSPSMDSLVDVDHVAQSSHGLKPPPQSMFMKISPPKRKRVDNEFSFTRPTSVLTPTNASAVRSKTWSLTQPKKLKLSKTLSLVKKPITPRKIKEEPRVKLYDTDFYLQSCINPDPFAATMACDPFLASTMYLDDRAVERHQIDFKKWLNALVSLPPELNTDNNAKIDVGKLFNEVRHKELQLAPTKEEQSVNYLTQFRLESLRRAAVQLYMSEELRVPCSKVVVYVNKNALRMRSDRNLHLDVVMQRYILELLLCFSPLWLRLGLEVVYGEKIHLQSNCDIVGLSSFILNRLFRDKFLEQKYSRAYTLSDEYADHIKKFTLQKMLLLLLFLDKAKQAGIIRHNPCLFVKKSPYKETKEILHKFSSELLANIGDITRDLKRLGYVLQHKQTFLDEFDYAFSNLAVDLRDGIRLTRVMEVILLRDDLSRQLRVPAISRLQRVYNVNLALRALSEADFQLLGDISAADIVDGHREKTLSLLWQIIYKFRSPKFHAAARTLQLWWRQQSLKVTIKRRIRERLERQRQTAATTIQAAFRGFITRKFAAAYRAERNQATIVLQQHIRRYLAQQHLRRSIAATVCIQRWYRSQREAKRCRLAYLQLQNCVVFVQRCYRRRLLSHKLYSVAQLAIAMRAERREAAACCIQQRWRAQLAGRQVRAQLQRQRSAVITLQRYYRAKRAAGQQQQEYVQLKRATHIIQQRWRAKREMVAHRAQYQQQRKLTIHIQRRWRATQLMRVARADYQHRRNAIITIQQRWRATCAMRTQHASYVQLRDASCCLQQHWRALQDMRAQRQQYEKQRASIICLQRHWRATLQGRRERETFIRLRRSVVAMQRRYRGKMLMRAECAAYERLRTAIINVQRRRRATLGMRVKRIRYERCRSAALTLQRWWRAHKCMRYTRAKYRGMHAAVTCLQHHWRAELLMRKERAAYRRLRDAAVVVQRSWRAQLLMRQQRRTYQHLRTVTICMQQRYRATRQMRAQIASYQQTRQLIVSVQRRWRATLQMHHTRQIYVEKRNAAIIVQRAWRAITAMRLQRARYERCRAAALLLQRSWRAQLQMRKQRAVFQRQRQAAIRVQCWYRSVQLMRSTRASYQQQRAAAIVLQQRYRAYRIGRQVRVQYLLIRSLIVCVQRKYRARLAMRIERTKFVLLRYHVIQLQQRFRGRAEVQRCRAQFQLLRSSTLQFQTHSRGYLARQRYRAMMTPEMCELLRQKRAAKIIQRNWRGYCVRKRFRDVRIALIRQNLTMLRATTTAVNTIKHKLQDAVRLLRGRFNVAESLNVLMQLERLSRTVPHLLMGHAEFISSFCYGIMAQAIRSEVDKQMIEYCSCIILNLARYNSSTANTFQRGGLTTIAQMLLRWCDKDTNIFNTLCTLVWVFAHCPKKREIIREFMTTTEAIYFMRETKKLVARKEKMVQNRQRATTLQQQNQRKVNFSSRALPSLEPDYGIICNKPYTFISSVYAFDVLLLKLGIKLYS